ncbi:MAG: DNA polymerase III subunit alpha [Patescibacteria group bacterium]|nr:DNA polymerase III subunit alpha [Patescibacteria group bacterium]
MEFVHLHVHSHYSLLDGLGKLDDLIAQAQEYNMPALALTDHGVMYGVIEFYKKATAAGIKPIIGVEAYLARNGLDKKRAKLDEKPYHLILLAKNQQGYQNLIKLTSIAHLEGFYYKPRIDWELLEKYHEGLIALSACIQGEIPQAILENQLSQAEKLALKYQKLFGANNFYLEVQHHSGNQDQEKVNNFIFEIAKKNHIPVVATNDVHYVNSHDAEAQDILLCMQTKKKKQDLDRMNLMDHDLSFRSPHNMIEGFKDHPEVIENSVKIAKMCDLKIELGEIKLPYFEVPNDKTADEYLTDICQQNIVQRYPLIRYEKEIAEDKKKPSDLEKQIQERLKYELEIIKKTGYASYFLIVQDFVNWAKKNNIVVGPGRGSAAGSIVSYLTNITEIDPLKYDLVFERFLNPERISMPDIDLDFADTRRNEVVSYVENKYGKDHVSQIITFGTMAARAAVRDVGRVLDFSYSFCDKLAKLIPQFTNLKDALTKVTELKELYNSNDDAKKILDMAQKLEGVARHASTHACGVLITREPLDHYVPLQIASRGDETIVSQYDMICVESLGLLKMDFLGLKNLTLIENCLEIIDKTQDQKINLETLSLEDLKTYRLLQDGQTTGVFQLESSGMKRYLKTLKPTNMDDIIAMVALYRPGPMQFIPDYINGKHGKRQATYLHPKLKPILDKTYGIAVYQEQVLQIARDLAGFTLGEADILRKAVGKKIAELLKQQKDKFVKGCVKNNIKKETALKIFEFIEPFAGYGFNKAHATSYATIAYQTAYLKANFPVEFMASLLTADENDSDRVAIEIEECKNMGIEVLPPDINESFKNFTVVVGTENPTIRFGLLAIKNVGSTIVDIIIKERKTNGLYQNLTDFLKRVQSKDLNKKSLESLIKSGALDNFGERNQLLENIENLLNFVRNIQKEKINGQKSLFGVLPVNNTEPNLKLKSARPATRKEKLSWEKNLLGLYVSEHPLKKVFEIAQKDIVSCSMIEEQKTKSYIKIIGVVTKIKKIITSNNKTMLFVKIEDSSGSLEVIVFPDVYNNNKNLWEEEKTLAIIGKVSDKDGTKKVIVAEAKKIEPDDPDSSLKTILSLQPPANNGFKYANQSGWAVSYNSFYTY